MAVKFLEQHITSQTWLNIYSIANRLNEKPLVKQCEQSIDKLFSHGSVSLSFCSYQDFQSIIGLLTISPHSNVVINGLEQMVGLHE